MIAKLLSVNVIVKMMCGLSVLQMLGNSAPGSRQTSALLKAKQLAEQGKSQSALQASQLAADCMANGLTAHVQMLPDSVALLRRLLASQMPATS